MDGATNLKQDLEIMKAMLEELANYLNSEAIFWPVFKEGYPQMTLGGFFMRLRRLERLSYLLVDADQVELKQYITQFKEMTYDKKALMVKKALRELEARTNQWEQNLKEYWDSEVIEKEYYKADAEVRTIIADLIFELEIDLSQDDKELLFKIDALDHELMANWQVGDFIWPSEWIPAYGKGEYWWLYGLPCIPESN